jgi:hypothetical protein
MNIDSAAAESIFCSRMSTTIDAPFLLSSIDMSEHRNQQNVFLSLMKKYKGDTEAGAGDVYITALAFGRSGRLPG